jgi:2-(1,2-epoxy-1,2-dihydrophenyl)acetyl-CoA isomerase
MGAVLLEEVSNGIATLTLHRPEKLNAYTVEMGVALVDAFRRLRDDARVRCVILAGAGRAFCAGVDLDALKEMRAGAAAPGPRLGEEEFVRGFPQELADYPKPVIAAIHGAAIGVGVTMTLLCDVRIAADDAVLALPFAKLGILPGLGSTHLLPRIVGLAVAHELVLTGRRVTASEALAMRLVNRVVPRSELADAARAAAALVAECDPDALAFAKRALRHGESATLVEAIAHEQAASAALRAARAGRAGPA